MIIVKFKEQVRTTRDAVLMRTWDNREVWLPLSCVWPDFNYTKGVAYIMPEWLCDAKKLDGKEYQPYHHPKKIEAIHNQEAIDELKL